MKTSSCFKRKSLSLLLAALLIAACGSETPEKMLSSAKDYLAKNDNKAAVIQIKNALQVNPSLPEARFLLGKALLDSGDATAAEVELRKALELKQPVDQVLPLLAKAMLQTRQYKKLIDELAQTKLGSADSQADLLTSIALAHAMQGQADAANTALAAALSAKPDHAPALIAQVRMKAGAQDFVGALATIDSIVAKTPTNFEAWKLKGDLLIAQGQGEQALSAYRKALEIRPDFVAAHAAIVSLFLQQSKITEAAQQIESLKKIAPKNPQTTYLEAQIAYQKQDYKAARDLAQQLLKQAPNNPNLLQLAGAVEFQLKSLLQAEAYLSKAVQAAPELKMARRLLITTYLRSGQTAKALSTLQPVLASSDKDANMLALAGEVFIQNGDAKTAEEYFAKAAHLDPADPKKRTALALTHMVKGDVDTAFGELEAIAATDKGSTADLAMISAYLRRNDLDKALKAIDSLEKKQPQNPLAANLRGRTLLAKQDVAGARKSFEKALGISPAYFPAAASLARLDLADKKPEEARKRFEAVLAVDAKNTQALLAIAELKASAGGTPEEVIALVSKAVQANPTDAAPRLMLIELNLRNKDAKKAVVIAQEAVSAIPDDASLLDALGRAQQAAGDTNQALATFNKLAALQPSSPQPQLRLAEAQLADKDKEAAIQSLRRALEIKPDLLEAQRGLIALYLEASRQPEALTVARVVQKQRPHEAIGYLLEGDIGASKKGWSEAISAYRTGLKESPSAELAAKLHSALRASGQGDEAEKFASSWMKQHPKDAAFMLYLADVAMARKDFEKAASYYRNMLEVQPNSAVALNNLAWVSGELKDPKALEYAEKANKLVPNQPAFMDTLAMLLSGKGEHAKALELLNQALKLQPQAAFIRLNLAKVLIKTGDKATARKELETLAKLGEKFPGQAEVALLSKGL